MSSRDEGHCRGGAGFGDEESELALGMLKEGSLWDSKVKVASRHLDVQSITQKTVCIKSKELRVGDNELV